MSTRMILVAEDSEDDRFILNEAITEACVDCPVRMVEDGQQALDYLNSAGAFADRQKFPAPDLLLLDLKMPVKNGFETLEELRAQDRWRFLPVLILSASSQPQDIEKAHRLGANGYLVKPTALADLTEMMKAVESFWLRFNHAPSPL